jgi:hypothetical protein
MAHSSPIIAKYKIFGLVIFARDKESYNRRCGIIPNVNNAFGKYRRARLDAAAPVGR